MEKEKEIKKTRGKTKRWSINPKLYEKAKELKKEQNKKDMKELMEEKDEREWNNSYKRGYEASKKCEGCKKEKAVLFCLDCIKKDDKRIIKDERERCLKMIEELVKKHRKVMIFCCEEKCLCWDLEELTQKIKGEK
mgnify:CR=1 FL=1